MQPDERELPIICVDGKSEAELRKILDILYATFGTRLHRVALPMYNCAALVLHPISRPAYVRKKKTETQATLPASPSMAEKPTLPPATNPRLQPRRSSNA